MHTHFCFNSYVVPLSIINILPDVFIIDSSNHFLGNWTWVVLMIIIITSRVICDMARLQRDYIISLFNDVMGVHDRTRPNWNTVTTIRIGLFKAEDICHAAALIKMRHFLRTGFGVSMEYLIWDLIHNPGGLGQGNGGGPTSFHSLMLPL